MEESTVSLGELGTASKQFARRLLTIGENRLELLTVEVQEERERLLHAMLLALGIGACGLLIAIVFTAVIVILFWDVSHFAILLTLMVFYGAGLLWLYRRLAALLLTWKTLPATLDQLRKDRACLDKNLD
ncbi:MAG: phage holin family protein [Limisphaerales bacterium]